MSFWAVAEVQSTIDFSAMRNAQDQHRARTIIDGVQDPVIAHADAVGIVVTAA
jgi:hypothetical protein